MFFRFLVIVNELEALGKTYTEVEKVVNILRSLPKKWETKVTTIQEAKDLTKLSLEKLIGSLMTYEINLNNHKKIEENKKSIAFMASKNDDEEEDSESESDEDSIEEECTNEDANMCFMALEDHEDELKRLVVKPKMAQSVEPNEEPIDPQLNRSRGAKKHSLSSRMVVQPIKVEPQLVDPHLNRSRSN
ncbi:hypothetical protein AAG906_033055 [Vitis piasezkii]